MRCSKWLSKKLNIQQNEDWYDITTKQIKNEGGGGLLHYYNYSLVGMLKDIHPEFNWLQFVQVSQWFWDKRQNKIDCLIWLEKELNIQQAEDWYNITVKQVIESGGAEFMTNYNNSISNMLNDMYPEFNWQPWRFSHAPHNFWDDPTHLRQYFDHIIAH